MAVKAWIAKHRDQILIAVIGSVISFILEYLTALKPISFVFGLLARLWSSIRPLFPAIWQFLTGSISINGSLLMLMALCSLAFLGVATSHFARAIRLQQDFPPFLAQFSTWVKVLVAVWFFHSVMLVLVFVFVPRSANETGGKNSEICRSSSFSTATATVNQTAKAPFYPTSCNSHWEAVRSGELELDCSSYQAAAEPAVYTYSRTVCETLAELRSNMKLIAQYRLALQERDEVVPDSPPTYEAAEWFMVTNRDKFMDPYGPKKERLEGLIQELQTASSTLSRAQTQEDLINWQSAGEFTIDDLFIANGFLDWIVSYTTKDILSPTQLYRFGPFYERAFPESGAVTFVSRALGDYVTAENGAEYVDILGAFD